MESGDFYPCKGVLKKRDTKCPLKSLRFSHSQNRESRIVSRINLRELIPNALEQSLG